VLDLAAEAYNKRDVDILQRSLGKIEKDGHNLEDYLESWQFIEYRACLELMRLKKFITYSQPYDLLNTMKSCDFLIYDKGKVVRAIECKYVDCKTVSNPIKFVEVVISKLRLKSEL
jgi:hypothetical protein